jgi:intracellular septation protein
MGAPETKLHPGLKLALDVGPLILFFVANAKFNIFVATAAFMAAIAAALAVSWVLTRHLPLMAIVSGVVVLVFGALTLVLRDETFIKVKPTIIYGLFGAVLAVGLAMGRPLLAVVFDDVLQLTDEGWRQLSLRWAIFFFAMALLNELVWRTQTTDFWVAFKLFGAVPLTFVFAAAQFPLMNRHRLPEVMPADENSGQRPD